MREKIAVVAPIPRARVSIAVRVKTGDNRICRSAYEISCRTVSMPAMYERKKDKVPIFLENIGDENNRRCVCQVSGQSL